MDRLLLGIDFGTTHCKAGIFAADGRLVGLGSQPTPTRRSDEGFAYYNAGEMWQAVLTAMQAAHAQAVDRLGDGLSITAIGVSSMSESGLFVDKATGEPRSFMLPWFDPVSEPQAQRILHDSDRLERFAKTGFYANFKISLSKILWFRERLPDITQGAVWLSASDYLVYRLTGRPVTDYSLAQRTFVFRIDKKEWDADFLRQFDLQPDLFPTALQAGAPAGPVLPGCLPDSLHAASAVVTVAGHDHICSSFGVGAVQPGQVFDSMGTAEAFVGAMDERHLGEKELHSGLIYGCHVEPNRFYWMGSTSASGGSIEWLRSLLGKSPLSYAELESIAAEAGPQPTGILYYPYLSGSGSPHPDPHVRGAFIGLDANHGRPALARAVLEGTAFEMEAIRQAAEQATGLSIQRILTAGGGTRNRTWMQIKADISGCTIETVAMPETTLLGAALLAGICSGFYRDEAQARSSLASLDVDVIEPDPARHEEYQKLFKEYMRLQSVLRE